MNYAREALILGDQTRHHSDLDIVIEQRYVDVATTALKRLGYAPVPRADTRPWNFVLGDDTGRQIDFHVIVFDERGRGLYGPPGTEDHYPAEALTGKGTLNGRAVDCITPEWLVRFHTGYPDCEFSHARDAAPTGDTPWRRQQKGIREP